MVAQDAHRHLAEQAGTERHGRDAECLLSTHQDAFSCFGAQRTHER
jgi:hypothetical protein